MQPACWESAGAMITHAATARPPCALPPCPLLQITEHYYIGAWPSEQKLVPTVRHGQASCIGDAMEQLHCNSCCHASPLLPRMLVPLPPLLP